MGGVAGLPAVTVQIGYGYGPGDIRSGAVVWTTIAQVRVSDGVSWSRGRQSERDTVSPGSASFTVNTRAFNTAFGGPPPLRTPIRIRDTASSTTLFTGTVDDWAGSWNGGIQPVTVVTATELLSRASLRTLSALPVEAQRAKSPAALFPLHEETSATSLASVIPQSAAGRLTPTITVGTTGTATWGAGYSPGSVKNAAESTVASFTGDATNYVQLTAAIDSVNPATAGVTLEGMILPASYPSGLSTYPAGVSGRDSDDYALGIGITGTGKASSVITASGGVSSVINGATTIPVADWSHLALTITSAGAVTLYLNGVSQGTDTISAGLFGALTTVTIGSAYWNGNLANVAVYPRVLSGTELSDLADGRTGFNSESTTDRAERIAGYCGYPITVGSGSTLMGPQPTKGASLADALQACADTEAAPYWMSGAGVLRLEGRATRYAPAAAAFTVPATALDQGTRLAQSDAGVINTVTATNAAGDTATRRNAASVARYDEYPLSVSVFTRTTAAGITDMETIAEGLANFTATPTVRSDQINFNLTTAAASITNLTNCRTADVGDVMQVTGLPTDHDTASSVGFFVEGVSDSVTTAGWSRTVNVSPLNLAAWELQDSTYGVLGTTTRLGF